jgi:hypothetical protein
MDTPFPFYTGISMAFPSNNSWHNLVTLKENTCKENISYFQLSQTSVWRNVGVKLGSGRERNTNMYNQIFQFLEHSSPWDLCHFLPNTHAALEQ